VRERFDVLLAGLTTLRVGGPARRLVEVTTTEDIVEVATEADSHDEAMFALGSGSNLVVSDDGFDGTLLHIMNRGIEPRVGDAEDEVIVRVAAGEPWDKFVVRAVGENWSGIECLAGIPGTVGATPVQNVGAYGQEVSSVIASVRVWDRRLGAIRTYTGAQCEFGYRTSMFRRNPRWIVLDVDFRLRKDAQSQPIRYEQVSVALNVQSSGRAPLAEVMRTVIDLRASKGMVLDAADHDTWSAGSFFVNPLLDLATTSQLPPDAPRWPQVDGTVKSSAAWLIEHAGFARGYGTGQAQLSGKHALAITNRGRATTHDVLALAREIRAGVRDRYRVDLSAEPILVGCEL
jgi:UDP-N-acetylmuramate dehydrogenase